MTPLHVLRRRKGSSGRSIRGKRKRKLMDIRQRRKKPGSTRRQRKRKS